MAESDIALNILNGAVSIDNLDKYFHLIEMLQNEVEQDTYLLMDNLYEENASCIDTYSLFLYLKHNNYKAKYVLYEKNPLYKKLKEQNSLDDIIVSSESSLTGTDLYEKLFPILIQTKYIILSFPDSLYPDLMAFAYRNKFMQVVGIGHGPVFFKTSILNFEKSNYLSPERFNLYLVSSLKEKRLFLQSGWPADKIFNIGLPRFDWCKKEKHKGKNIVIMFTWRLDSFRNSPDVSRLKYFKNLKSLLNNKRLQQIAKTAGYNVIIAIHHSIKDLCDINLEIPGCYKIADTNNLIQYINTADLFITDYSSIVHDFMFLNIPVVFYRLDYGDPLLCELDKIDLEESREKDNQVFNVFYNEDDVINKIEYYVNNDFVLEAENIEIENSFFTEKKDLCQKFVMALENYQGKELVELSVKPVWNDVKSAICVSSSNEYVPYLCVYLKSVINSSSSKKDIVIFERDISLHNKERILNYFLQDDVSVRFINPTSLFKNVNLYVSHDYFKEECYYRIAAPKLLNEYNKIIFTDLDLIVSDDILKLADIDMQGHPVAACIEPIWRELYMQNNKIYNTCIRSYTNNVLKLSNPFMYYNTGVVVFDVKEYNRLNSFDLILDIISKNQLLYQEQCALNIFFKDNFYTLSQEWNYELAPSLVNNTYRFDFYDEYKEKEKNAKILHFLGRYKPWKNVQEYKASEWWHYARQIPFYEEILQRMIQHQSSQAKTMDGITQLRSEFVNIHFPNINNHFAKNEKDMKLLFVMAHPVKFRLKKWCYGIKKAFAFGKRHKKYQNKFNAVKQLIKEAKIYEKQLAGI